MGAGHGEYILVWVVSSLPPERNAPLKTRVRSCQGMKAWVLETSRIHGSKTGLDFETQNDVTHRHVISTAAPNFARLLALNEDHNNGAPIIMASGF